MSKKPDSAENKNISGGRGKTAPRRLSEKLLQIRRQHRLSQAEMLKVIKPEETNPQVNRSLISQYERGRRIPSLIEIWNYAKFARISVEILINDEADLPF